VDGAIRVYARHGALVGAGYVVARDLVGDLLGPGQNPLLGLRIGFVVVGDGVYLADNAVCPRLTVFVIEVVGTGLEVQPF